MINSLKLLAVNHISWNSVFYIVIIVIFVLGIGAGLYGVSQLNVEQQSELVNYLNLFFAVLSDLHIEPTVIAQQAVMDNLKIILFIWFLGLTVIGVPLIPLIVFFHGFVMGFTVAFLIQQKALEGFLITVLAILPPNIINLPAVFVGSASAVSFSYWLVKDRRIGDSPQFCINL